MVTVINFEKRKNSKQEEFMVLEIQGDVEMLRATGSGKFYAHARKTTITTTVNEATCRSLIGKKFPGEIKKVECAEYSYQIPGTNETTILKHTYEYFADNASAEETVFQGEVA